MEVPAGMRQFLFGAPGAPPPPPTAAAAAAAAAAHGSGKPGNLRKVLCVRARGRACGRRCRWVLVPLLPVG